MPRRTAVLLSVLALAAAGCGEGHDHGAMTDGAADDATVHDGSTDHGHTSSFGAPGDPAAADSAVEVTATDALAFDPSSIQVAAGETVTFIVTNSGKLPHEFVLGDAAYQAAHEDQMSSGAGHGVNGISIAPGATREITWTFSEAGTFEFACHVEGHYPGGMRGTIRVG